MNVNHFLSKEASFCLCILSVQNKDFLKISYKFPEEHISALKDLWLKAEFKKKNQSKMKFICAIKEVDLPFILKWLQNFGTIKNNINKTQN